MSERNPTIVPPPVSPEARRPCCPACKGTDFGGIKVQGVVTFTCRNAQCRNQWQGGLPREGYDPFQPHPVEETPAIDYGQNPRTKEIEEIRQRPSLTPEFRKGALIDPDEG